MGEVRELLPIGSIVSIEESCPLVMIIGRAVIDSDQIVWDYVGVPYPGGYIGEGALTVFSREMVLDVYFPGIDSSKNKELTARIEAILNELKNNLIKD